MLLFGIFVKPAIGMCKSALGMCKSANSENLLFFGMCKSANGLFGACVNPCLWIILTLDDNLPG